MKVDYDQRTDILTLTFTDTPVEESDEIRPGIILDFNREGQVVGMEILDASRHMDNPAAVEFAVQAA